MRYLTGAVNRNYIRRCSFHLTENTTFLCYKAQSVEAVGEAVAV